MCLNEFTVALLIRKLHKLSLEVHMEVAGPAPREGFVRVRSVDVILGLKDELVPHLSAEKKPGGNREGVLVLASFVCIQTADK